MIYADLPKPRRFLSVDELILCPLFGAVLAKLKRLRSRWDYFRSVIRHFVFASFAELWRAILLGSLIGRAPPVRV